LLETPEGGDSETWLKLVQLVLDTLADPNSTISRMKLMSHSKFNSTSTSYVVANCAVLKDSKHCSVVLII